MNALIFAAGLGTRLKPLTDTMPKAMVPVNGKPLVQILIEKLKGIGVTEIVINVHHFAQQIIDFVEANEIEAGVPYIVKWTTTGSNIVNPVFRNVTVSHESPNYHEVISKDKKVGFVGTYAPVKITVNDKSSLFLGAENKLYYPNDANDVDGTYHVNAFRAYLHIDPSAEVKEFRLRFGEDDEDGIVNANLNVNRNDGAIYNLSGQRLNKMQKGVNIVNGRKVLF